MAGADFWRELAAKFRELPNDRGMFRLDWSTVFGKPGIRWEPFATDATRVQFEALATRAGLALDPDAPNLLWAWLATLKESRASRELYTKTTLRDEGGLDFITIYGRISDPCGASAVQCNLLEARALEEKREAPLLLPQDTKTLVTKEAARIDRGAARSSGKINSPLAASRMKAFIEASGMTQPAFATLAQTTDRTIRSFGKTGKVRKDIFRLIASAMGAKPEDLLKPDPGR